MKLLCLCLCACVAAVAALAFVTDADAATARRLPSFEMKDLQEREHRLTDERFQGKRILVAGFGTWQQVSIDQARELEKFHRANPNVEIVAFVVDDLPTARDFVTQEGLTFPCYKTDNTPRIGSAFNRLFDTRRGKTLTLNRVPFVILTDANRNVVFTDIGLVNAETLQEKLR